MTRVRLELTPPCGDQETVLRWTLTWRLGPTRPSCRTVLTRKELKIHQGQSPLPLHTWPEAKKMNSSGSKKDKCKKWQEWDSNSRPEIETRMCGSGQPEPCALDQLGHLAVAEEGWWDPVWDGNPVPSVHIRKCLSGKYIWGCRWGYFGEPSMYIYLVVSLSGT